MEAAPDYSWTRKAQAVNVWSTIIEAPSIFSTIVILVFGIAGGMNLFESSRR